MKIVICDDVQLSIDTIRAYIHKLCADSSIVYDTEIFYDGREMVEHWLQHTDFCFVDVRMEMMDGISACKKGVYTM